jgi:hypothetical protein
MLFSSVRCRIDWHIDIIVSEVHDTSIFNVLGFLYREVMIQGVPFNVSLSTAALSHTKPASVCTSRNKSRARRHRARETLCDDAQVQNYCGTASFYRHVHSIIDS